MANSSHKPEFIFDGNYEKFPSVLRAIENFLLSNGIKFKQIQPEHEISLAPIYYFMLMSNCPAKDVNYLNGWTVAGMCDQNDIDRPGPNNLYFREVLESFEEEVILNQTQSTVQNFFGRVLGLIIPFFKPDLPAVLSIDRTDPFCCIRFLQTVYAGYLEYVRMNSSKIVHKIIDKARSWTGGDAENFSEHLRGIQKLISELPASVSQTFDVSMIIDSVITSLRNDRNLHAVHSYIRSTRNSNPNQVTFDYIEREVKSILDDVKPEPVLQTNEDPIASMASESAFYNQQKKRSFQGNSGKLQTRSPISKKESRPQRIPTAVWELMSQDARNAWLADKRSKGPQGQSQRGSGGRCRGGPGGRSSQPQRHGTDAAEAEMAAAENVHCFNSEISREISELSDIGHESMEFPTAPEAPKAAVFFAEAETSTDEEPPQVESSPNGDSPKMESSPNGLTASDSFSWWPIWFIAFLLSSFT